ncbi:MAG: hypothetical protein JWM38_2503 [Sphingomonas bacterium]|nr:hypothetical protein [Sphingomonas bacterium]
MRFDIQAFVDRQRVRAIHISVLMVMTLVMFIDGFDIFMIGKIAPAIADGFGQPAAALTKVFFFQQIGLAIGAFAATPLADRVGRKRMLLITSTAFGVLTLAGAFATSLDQLAILRGLSGIFLSGGLPVAMALLAEITPKHRRSTFLAISLAGYSSGSASGAAVAAWLVADYGWQSGFWVGGILPLVSVPLLLFLVPESLQFRAARNPVDPSIARTLRRIDRSVELTGNEQFSVGDGSAPREKASLFDIFREGRGRATTLIWLSAILGMGTTALLANWLPTYFREMAGISIQRFAIASMISFAGGLLGTLTVGYLLDRVRASRLIPLYYIGMAAMLALLGHVPFGTTTFVLVFILMSFCQTGGQSGINMMVTQTYPASVRSTGLGWAGGAGRIGGIIAPLLGALALTSHLTLPQTLTLVALPPLGVAFLIFLLGYQFRGKPSLARAAA